MKAFYLAGGSYTFLVSCKYKYIMQNMYKSIVPYKYKFIALRKCKSIMLFTSQAYYFQQFDNFLSFSHGARLRQPTLLCQPIRSTGE
jgi:hypothetical protein